MEEYKKYAAKADTMKIEDITSNEQNREIYISSRIMMKVLTNYVSLTAIRVMVMIMFLTMEKIWDC